MTNTILTNSGAIFIGASLDKSRSKLINAQSQLASGLKNPDPSRDPSSTTIGIGIKSQVEISEVVLDVVSQAASVLQLGVGVLQSSAEILTRMKNLAIRSRSSTIDDSSRIQLDAEFQQIMAQLNLNANTKWGDQPLFDGTYINKDYQIGLDITDVLNVSFSDMTVTTLLGGTPLSIANTTDAATAIAAIETGVDTLLSQLATIASYRARLETASDTMTTMKQNLQSALSTYQDADITLALTEAQRQNTLVDAASAALENNIAIFGKLGRLIQSALN